MPTIENDGLFLSLFVSCSLYSFLSFYRILVYYTFSVGRNVLLDSMWTFEIKNHRTGKIWHQVLVSIKGEDFFTNSAILILSWRSMSDTVSYRYSLPCFWTPRSLHIGIRLEWGVSKRSSSFTSSDGAYGVGISSGSAPVTVRVYCISVLHPPWYSQSGIPL